MVCAIAHLTTLAAANGGLSPVGAHAPGFDILTPPEIHSPLLHQSRFFHRLVTLMRWMYRHLHPTLPTPSLRSLVDVQSDECGVIPLMVGPMPNVSRGVSLMSYLRVVNTEGRLVLLPCCMLQGPPSELNLQAGEHGTVCHPF